MIGSIGAGVVGAAGTALTASVSGGVSVPIVGGVTVALRGALAVNAAHAATTSGIMNSIANSHGGNGQGSKKENKNARTEGTNGGKNNVRKEGNKNIFTNEAGNEISWTDSHIIEAQRTLKAVEKDQIDKLTNPDNINYFNHDGKEIVYYIVDMTATHSDDLVKLQMLEDAGVTIVNTTDDLKGVISQ